MQMLKIITSRDFTHVRDLSALFRVSQVTIRADLNLLAAQGYIQRLRGGAQPRKQMGSSCSVQQVARMYDQAAADLVHSGETILLDAGTPAAGIARALVKRTEVRDLVIFTNALPVALELESAIPRFSVVVTGGTLNPLDHALVNPLGNLLLNGIQVDTLFLVADGIDLRGGLTTNSLAQAESKRRMIQMARRRVVIAGSSRLRSIQLFSFCTLHEIDILITDRLANPVMIQALQQANVQVILVETDRQISGSVFSL